MKKWGPAIQTSLSILSMAAQVAMKCTGVDLPIPVIPFPMGKSVNDKLSFLTQVSE
jgi:hypothetical protein